MKRIFFFQCGISLFFLGFFIYSYLEKQNNCTKMKMIIPKITKEVSDLLEENGNLQYQIECFENPEHLLEIVAAPEYRHFKFPFTEEVLIVKKGLALQPVSFEEKEIRPLKGKSGIVIGAKP